MIASLQDFSRREKILLVLIPMGVGLLCAAIVFAIGAVLLAGRDRAPFLQTFIGALVFGPMLAGMQAVASMVTAIALEKAHWNPVIKLILTGAVAATLGVALFHSSIGKPSVDLAWSIFNNTVLFLSWNFALGCACWLTFSFLARRFA